MKNTFISKAALCVFTVVIGCLVAFQAMAEEVLNNSSIIELQKIGLSEGTIVQKIKNSKCNFDTSIGALKQLKSANVSDAIIQAMMTAPAGSSATMNVAAAPAGEQSLAGGDANDPMASHELGIWLFQKENGKNKMTELEPAMFNQMKTGSGWGLGWGGSMHMRVALNGPKAKMQLSERKPVFYFYFGESTLNGATSPAEFTLVKAEIKKDHDVETRMLITGKVNAYSGTSMGFDPKFVIAFDFDKVAKGTYKVIPKDDLPDGEYCFCQGSFAAGAVGKVFDFGVSGQ